MADADGALGWERETAKQARVQVSALRSEVLALEQALEEAEQRAAGMVDVAELEREREHITQLAVGEEGGGGWDAQTAGA